MKYEVVLTDEAQENAHIAYNWYAERSQKAADKWHEGLLEALTTLETDPQRFGHANENARFPIELRQLLYGSGRRITHRIIFAIRPTRAWFTRYVMWRSRNGSLISVRPPDIVLAALRIA